MRPPLGSNASARPSFVGVVHLAPLPGAPRFAGSMDEVLERAVADARALSEGGCDALIVENFGDVPFFPEEVAPETVAAMTLAVARVQEVADGLPIGVNVLRNDARAALAICAASGAAFVRVNVHTGAAVTDQGVVRGRAAETLRERARIAAPVKLLADVHVKHSTPLGAESLTQAARDAVQRGLADGLIVTGDATGQAPDVAMLREVREAVQAPLWVGSGLDNARAEELLPLVDGAIVGTSLKQDGDVSRPVDIARVRQLREAFDRA